MLFCPMFLSLVVGGLFCTGLFGIHTDYVASLYHVVNGKLLLNKKKKDLKEEL